MTIWFKNNKAAEKYSDEDVILILSDVLEWLEANDGVGNAGEVDAEPVVKLKTEVELYMLKEHGVSHETCRSWITSVHNNNKSITGLFEAINLTIENRLVYDKDIRPNIQALVLQSKHNYRERKDINADVKFDKMPKVMIGDKALDINPKGDENGDENS